MTRTTVLALAIAAAVSMPAHAQFGKLKNPLADTGSTSATSEAAVPNEAMQESLVRRFIASQALSLQAQESFAKAFGLAEQVQLLEAERQALSSGSVNVDQIKKSVSISKEAQAAIDERVAAQPELSDEAKEHYVNGLMGLVGAVAEGRKLGGEASNFTSGIKGLSPIEMATATRKLGAGLWVAKETPGYLQGLYSSTKAALTFATKSKVKLPANADSMLDGLL